jgi:hypothetical protein
MQDDAGEASLIDGVVSSGAIATEAGRGQTKVANGPRPRPKSFGDGP